MGLFSRKKNKDNTINNKVSLSSRRAGTIVDPYDLFKEYLDKVYNEIKDLPFPISQEMIRVETGLLLYNVADCLAKQERINHATFTGKIYEGFVKEQTQLSIFQVVNRTTTYLSVFVEPRKAKGIWLMSSDKKQNPFISCWYAFGDILTNPHCVEDLDTYFSSWSINLYEFPEQLQINSGLLEALNSYSDYLEKICDIIDLQK